MTAINNRKRAAHRRRVQASLHEIFNDPAIMPNADCRDLVVSVGRVEFGNTVRTIYVDFRGQWPRPLAPGDEAPHHRYLREAAARGESTYVDLTDVAMFPDLIRFV